VSGLDPRTLDPLVRTACEQAVRTRLKAIAASHVADRERLAAKRRSLDLLHFTVKEGGAVDDLQIRVLLDLLDQQEHEVDARRAPLWPGAQHAFFGKLVDEKFLIHEARRALHAVLGPSDRATGRTVQ
jgi:2'-5' RNA ligase